MLDVISSGIQINAVHYFMQDMPMMSVIPSPWRKSEKFNRPAKEAAIQSCQLPMTIPSSLSPRRHPQHHCYWSWYWWRC